MDAAKFVVIFAGIFLPLLLIVWGVWVEGSKAAKDKTRARRIADAKMNARLLRLDI